MNYVEDIRKLVGHKCLILNGSAVLFKTIMGRFCYNNGNLHTEDGVCLVV